MAFDKNVPLAANQIAADLAAINANWEFTSPGVVTTAGDTTYASAAGVMARLAIGAANLKKFVNAAGTAPEWASGLSSTYHSYDLATASGNQTLTGAGFTPTGALCFYGYAIYCQGIGLKLDTEHTLITAQNSALAGAVEPYFIQALPATGNYQLGVLTFNSDGGVIAWTKTLNPTGTLLFSVLWLR